MVSAFNNTLVEASRKGDLLTVAQLAAAASATALQSALMVAVDNGHAACVAELVKHTTPTFNDNLLLRKAAASGQMECLKVLLPLSDPGEFGAAFFAAGRNHHFACVGLVREWAEHNGEGIEIPLPQYVGAAARERNADFLVYLLDLRPNHVVTSELMTAVNASKKHFENDACVQALLPFCTEQQCNEALIEAAKNGYTACVKILLDKADPLFDNSKALQEAVVYGHPDTVDVLYGVSNRQQALFELHTQDHHLAQHRAKRFEQRVVEDQRRALEQESAENGVARVARKL